MKKDFKIFVSLTAPAAVLAGIGTALAAGDGAPTPAAPAGSQPASQSATLPALAATTHPAVPNPDSIYEGRTVIIAGARW